MYATRNERAAHRTGRIIVALGLLASSLVAFPGATPAHAKEHPVSGSTSANSCTWFTSNNVRFTTVASKTVRVKMSDVGPLGVKMRTKNENTGNTSVSAFYPPLGEYRDLGSFAKKDSPFRFQFTCVTTRDPKRKTPDTQFWGTADY
jgi:hypothetical protein